MRADWMKKIRRICYEVLSCHIPAHWMIFISSMIYDINVQNIGSGKFEDTMMMMTDRSEMVLYDVHMFMSLSDLGIGMMFTSFHV